MDCRRTRESGKGWNFFMPRKRKVNDTRIDLAVPLENIFACFVNISGPSQTRFHEKPHMRLTLTRRILTFVLEKIRGYESIVFTTSGQSIFVP
jgi:hypothetical protein